MTKVEEKQPVGEQRDEELDVAKATERVREFIKKNVGNLLSLQFRLEWIKQNGSNTRYNVLCSVVPDLGDERDYYLIKIDVVTEKVVLPVYRGKLKDGKIDMEPMEIDKKLLE